MISNIVETFLITHNLTEKNILVAFSGGYDSMCLLHILKELSCKYNYKLTAIHLNHNWRGEESDNEELNCRNFCLDIDFYSEKLPTNIPHTETSARDARYEFFNKCAKKFNSNVIFTAHNANDNAETIFYRLLKGTGITGLQGIPAVRDIYYRPLLTIFRKDIENYCHEHNLTPNCDSSNNNTKFARNKIRNEIFPIIKEISPNFEIKLNELSNSALATCNIITNTLKMLESYSSTEFVNLNQELKNVVVHSFMRQNNFDYDKKKIEDIVDFIDQFSISKAGKTMSLTKNKWLFVNNQKIELISKKNNTFEEIHLTECGSFCIGNNILTIEKCNKTPDEFPKDDEFTAYISTNKIDYTLRTRKDGDIIYPLGLNGKQKLKKYLNSKKIPKHEKDNVLLLTKKNEVLWVVGIGLSEKLKVIDKPTHILKIRRA